MRRILAEYLPAKSVVEVIELYEEPERDDGEHVLAISDTGAEDTGNGAPRDWGSFRYFREYCSIGFIMNPPGTTLFS